MKTRRKKAASGGTAFVPRVVFQTLFAGVMPAVALGCSSTTMPNDAADSAQDGSVQPDALGVADIGFDAGRPDPGFISLAQIGFEVLPGVAPDTNVVEGEPGVAPDLTVAQRGASARRTPRRGRA